MSHEWASKPQVLHEHLARKKLHGFQSQAWTNINRVRCKNNLSTSVPLDEDKLE